jgi:hypothetical protein
MNEFIAWLSECPICKFCKLHTVHTLPVIDIRTFTRFITLLETKMPPSACHYLPIPLKSSKNNTQVICRIEGSSDSLPLIITAVANDNGFSTKSSSSTPQLG